MTAACLLVGLASLRYLIPGAPGGAPPILANGFARYGLLTIHAGFAATALMAGPPQFMAGLRARHPGLHRGLGRVYVVSCFLGGAAGLALAFGAKTGWISTLGFGLLAILWIHATGRALFAVLDGRLVSHRRWMIRSFALALAAVTLRVYLPFAFLAPFGYDAAYRAISFLCWVPNLVIAEILLARDPRFIL